MAVLTLYKHACLKARKQKLASPRLAMGKKASCLVLFVLDCVPNMMEFVVTKETQLPSSMFLLV